MKDLDSLWALEKYFCPTNLGLIRQGLWKVVLAWSCMHKCKSGENLDRILGWLWETGRGKNLRFSSQDTIANEDIFQMKYVPRLSNVCIVSQLWIMKGRVQRFSNLINICRQCLCLQFHKIADLLLGTHELECAIYNRFDSPSDQTDWVGRLALIRQYHDRKYGNDQHVHSIDTFFIQSKHAHYIYLWVLYVWVLSDMLRWRWEQGRVILPMSSLFSARF